MTSVSLLQHGASNYFILFTFVTLKQSLHKRLIILLDRGEKATCWLVYAMEKYDGDLSVYLDLGKVRLD